MRFRLINQSLGALVLPFLAEFLLVLLFSQLYDMALDAYKIGLCRLDCIDARKNLTRRLVGPFNNRVLLFFPMQFGFKHIRSYLTLRKSLKLRSQPLLLLPVTLNDTL